MKLSGKARSVPRSARWRIDCDYLDQLAPAERAYIEKFLCEYYLGNLTATERLHQEAQLKSLYVDRDVARRDIVTATSEEVERACSPAPNGNLGKRGTYSPNSYPGLLEGTAQQTSFVEDGE